MITVHICNPGERTVHREHDGAGAYCIPVPESQQPGGISILESIDDFVIDPGIVFDRHSHRDVEILTYVVDGAIDHRDETGDREVLLGGEVHYLHAGNGLTHSEANASRTDTVHVVQATLEPAHEPHPDTRYQQRYFPDDAKLDRLCLIASGKDDTVLRLSADVNVYASVMRPNEPLLYYRPKGRSTWAQVARGSVMLNDVLLGPGDAAAIEGEQDDTLRFLAQSECELLLFDLS